MPISFGSENRQHISLSFAADHIIREDSLNHYGTVNISGCINRIIRNYRDAFSVSGICGSRYEGYSGAIGSLLSPDLKDKVVQALIDQDIAHHLQKTYPKDVSYKIRLHDDIWEELYGSDIWPEQQYYSSQGSYIKALIEDYSRLTTLDREKIFYKETIEKLEAALNRPQNDRRIVRLKYVTASGKSRLCHVKPFSVLADPAMQYHYLIAQSKSDVTNQFELASFRISRIQDGSIVEHAKSFGSGKIPEKDRAEIENKLKKQGVQFLLHSEESIQIRLTPSGVRMYKTQYYLRPPVSSIKSITSVENGDSIYEFSCSPLQIEYYFFRFGKEAQILAPPSLRDTFRDRYLDASILYQS